MIPVVLVPIDARRTMKPAMFSEGITFYAPPALVEQARKKATDEGRTMSELMRAALRREVLSNAA